MGQERDGTEWVNHPQAEELVERLRERVAQRRANGDYPDDLEDRLDAHFRRIVFHRNKAQQEQLYRAIEKLDASMDFTPPEIPAESGFPGGELVHRAIGKAITRHQQVTFERMSVLAEVVREVLHATAQAVKDPSSHVHSDLVGQIDALLERLDRYERDSNDERKSIDELRDRVERLEVQLGNDRAQK